MNRRVALAIRCAFVALIVTIILRECAIQIRGPISAVQAREISDSAALTELASEQERHQKRDPSVSFALDDFSVEVIEETNSYRFVYEYDRIQGGFLTWLGHPMHFAVVVKKRNGWSELHPGS